MSLVERLRELEEAREANLISPTEYAAAREQALTQSTVAGNQQLLQPTPASNGRQAKESRAQRKLSCPRACGKVLLYLLMVALSFMAWLFGVLALTTEINYVLVDCDNTSVPRFCTDPSHSACFQEYWQVTISDVTWHNASCLEYRNRECDGGSKKQTVALSDFSNSDDANSIVFRQSIATKPWTLGTPLFVDSVQPAKTSIIVGAVSIAICGLLLILLVYIAFFRVSCLHRDIISTRQIHIIVSVLYGIAIVIFLPASIILSNAPIISNGRWASHYDTSKCTITSENRLAFWWMSFTFMILTTIVVAARAKHLPSRSFAHNVNDLAHYGTATPRKEIPQPVSTGESAHAISRVSPVPGHAGAMSTAASKSREAAERGVPEDLPPAYSPTM